jgi:hypothetical protein
VIYKIWITFIMIYNASRIPKLPRMLAGDYEQIPKDVVDVMRRLGCRDPRGVKVAMKRYGVNTIDELVAILEYQQPKRNIRHRLWLALARLIGETSKPTHSDEIIASMPRFKRNKGILEIRQRVKIAKGIFRGDE